ncbi:MAG: hypothetical protein OEZ11_02765 [Gammaproteobacteria bacterium]|nr:hypothetical protein [Gammaproteobacteria bacterium]
MNARICLAVLLFLAVWSGARAAGCTGEDQGKALQVAQKLDLLERLLDDSEPLRRAEQEGNETALANIEKARRSMAEARAALNDGCITEASALSSSGLKLATTAFRKSPDSSKSRTRETYERALQLATSFLLSLEAQPEELRGVSAEDLVGIERQIERAESLASSGNFGEALRLLAPVNDRLQRRLAAILDSKTLYYEKNFASRADEYSYYKDQYEGYLMLLRSAQVEPSYSAQGRVSALLDRAEILFNDAEANAAAESWDIAIVQIQDAVNQSEQAVRASGYTY